MRPSPIPAGARIRPGGIRISAARTELERLAVERLGPSLPGPEAQMPVRRGRRNRARKWRKQTTLLSFVIIIAKPAGHAFAPEWECLFAFFLSCEGLFENGEVWCRSFTNGATARGNTLCAWSTSRALPVT